MKKIAIMGAGSWGCALAILLNKNGHKVSIWAHTQDLAEAINFNHENKEYLPQVSIPNEIFVSSDSDKVLENADYIIVAIPSKFVRECLEKFHIQPNSIIINVSKGIEGSTFLTMSQIIKDIVKDCQVVTLSGPTHAEEVSRFLPTTCVAACENLQVAMQVQQLFNNEFFRVYTSTDIIGVELGATLKNIIALASGVADGLGFGDNTKAAIISRGILEIARFGEKLGARSETFYGLSGMGDLIVTCISNHSRNRRAGILLGQGYTLEETLEKVHMVVEGVNAAKTVNELAKKLKIDMPIVSEINKMLYEGKSPKQSVLDLMMRQPKEEDI